MLCVPGVKTRIGRYHIYNHLFPRLFVYLILLGSLISQPVKVRLTSAQHTRLLSIPSGDRKSESYHAFDLIMPLQAIDCGYQVPTVLWGQLLKKK